MSPNDRGLFAVDELLAFGWGKTKENLRPLVTLGALGMGLALLERAAGSDGRPGAVGLLTLLVQLFQLAIAMAWIRVALDACDGKPVALPKLGALWPDYLSFLIGALLAGLLIALGFVALVLPGIWLALTFGFFGFLVVDQRLSPGAALRESARLTRGVKAQLFGVGVVFLFINLGGALLFGVGLLLTVPVTFIAGARIYRRLQQRPAPAPDQPTGGALLAHGGRP
jgi:uncharacterized membrane protein